MKKNNSYLPVLIDVSGLSCLVVGAGLIAYRKVLTLLDFNANVTVISPKFCNELLSLVSEKKINAIKREYVKGDSGKYRIVFAATGNPDVDKLISLDCSEHNILLNVADVPELCSFIMPATIKQGDMTISIGSQGNAPFFTKAVKEIINNAMPESLADISEIAGEFRSLLIKSGIYKDEIKRETLIKKFLSMNWDEIIRKAGKESALRLALELIS